MAAARLCGTYGLRLGLFLIKSTEAQTNALQDRGALVYRRDAARVYGTGRPGVGQGGAICSARGAQVWPGMAEYGRVWPDMTGCGHA